MIKNNYLLLIAMVLLLGVISSCSVEKNRKVLSFFFDGVPDGSEKVIAAGNTASDEVKIRNKPVIELVKSQHPDHKTRNCSKCHSKSSANFLVTDRKKLCFTCHKQEKFEGPFIHGPVAVRACNTCHDPHQSKNTKLLIEKGRKLCDLCHRLPVTNDPIPCKGDNCLDCHDPHIGNNRFFLKKNSEQITPNEK